LEAIGIYFKHLQKIEKIMSNTFKKTSVRGFTLIELLVVIAIIGLLSTIIAAPIQSARKKARDAKKIAELKSTELALEQFAESNSAQYPSTLGALSPQFMPLLSSFAASTTSNARDAFVYTYSEAQATGGASSTFSYHLGVKLEVYGPALETDRDCIFPSLSTSLVTPRCSVYNGNTMFSSVLNNGSQLYPVASTSPTTFGAVAGHGGRDFEALASSTLPIGSSPYSEDKTSTCTVTNDCIFDVTSQQ
jgi:prepilin-type N-terminal cleavage/methylation domain-containing protein